MGVEKDKRLRAAAIAIAAVGLVAGCYRPSPSPPTEVGRWSENEFAARAAAIQKTCELAAVYVGRDDTRAAALVVQAREETVAAMRGAPDAWRGALFAAAYARLDRAAFTLEGVGKYNLPLSSSEAENMRRELIATADDLAPVAGSYYEALAAKYEGPGRRRTEWGPRPPGAENKAPSGNDVKPRLMSESESSSAGEGGRAPTAAEGP